jgi:hypothetical protein
MRASAGLGFMCRHVRHRVPNSRQRPVAIPSGSLCVALQTEIRPFADDASHRPAYAAGLLDPWSLIVVNTEPKYPSRRSYVLKLRWDARPEALTGRLENLLTGRQCEFSCAEELLASIGADLAAAAGELATDA